MRLSDLEKVRKLQDELDGCQNIIDDPSKVMFVGSLESMPKDRIAEIFNLIKAHFRHEKSQIIENLNTLGVSIDDDSL